MYCPYESSNDVDVYLLRWRGEESIWGEERIENIHNDN